MKIQGWQYKLCLAGSLSFFLSFFLFPPLPLSQQVPNFLHELYCVLDNAEILLEFPLSNPRPGICWWTLLFPLYASNVIGFSPVLLLGLAGSARKCLSQWRNRILPDRAGSVEGISLPPLPELADTGDIVKIFEGILFLLGEGPWFTGWCQHSCFSSKLLIKVADVFTTLNYWHKGWLDLTSQ